MSGVSLCQSSISIKKLHPAVQDADVFVVVTRITAVVHRNTKSLVEIRL